VTEWTSAAELLGLDLAVCKFVVPIFVVAFSGYCYLFWQLKPAHVLICVGEDDFIAWSKISVLALPERIQKKSLWSWPKVCLTSIRRRSLHPFTLKTEIARE